MLSDIYIYIYIYRYQILNDWYLQVQTVKRKAADMSLAKKLWEVSAKDVKLTEAEAAAL